MRRWCRFLAARTFRLLVVLFALIVGTFFLLHLVPGDPARAMAGPQASHHTVETIRADLGLDRPLIQQFGSHLTNVIHGDLGESYKTRESVLSVLGQGAVPTAQLAVFGMLVILVIGIPLGLFGAVYTRPGKSRFEIIFSALTGAASALPHYLTATFLAFLFSVKWGVFPVAGAATLSAAILPAIAIALRPTALVARLVRIRTLEVLEQPYIRAARSKHLRGSTFYVKHVFPNAITTTLAMGGVLFASLVGGAVVVEIVFARPGLGTTLVQSVLIGNFPVVQGVVLTLGVCVVVANTVVDIILGIVDPETLEGSHG